MKKTLIMLVVLVVVAVGYVQGREYLFDSQSPSEKIQSLKVERVIKHEVQEYEHITGLVYLPNQDMAFELSEEEIELFKLYVLRMNGITDRNDVKPGDVINIPVIDWEDSKN